MQLIRPNPRQLLYLAGTLGLLSLLLPVAFERPLHQFWIEHWIAPKLQHDLGFTAGYREVAPGQGPAFLLLTVTPGGRLYRAGFRAGDIPVGYQHGFVSGFYDDLLAVSDGRQVEIAVIPAGVAARGSEDWKRLRVAP